MNSRISRATICIHVDQNYCFFSWSGIPCRSAALRCVCTICVAQSVTTCRRRSSDHGCAASDAATSAPTRGQTGRSASRSGHPTIAALRLSIGHQSAYSAAMSRQDIDFTCRHCGARYVVSYTELPVADSGSVYCKCCKRRMVQWNSALQPRYRLVERPERHHP